MSGRRKAADLIADKARGAKGAEQDEKLIASLRAEVASLRRARAPKIIARRGKAAKHITRVVIPDSHGAHIDPAARRAFLADLRELSPDEIVGLGDHVDCGGTFNSHQRNYTNELTESYEDDLAAANEFLDDCQAAAPNAEWDYIEGNHEAHVERWVARNFHNYRDAEATVALIGPAGRLRLKERGIRYHRRSTMAEGLSIPGTIRKGRCFFTHAISHAKNAAQIHLDRFSASVVFGHTHRAQSEVGRTVTSDGHGAFCPGTLAKLQPLYRHTTPTSHTHGYAVQFVAVSTGVFLHINVPIVGGVSMLQAVMALGRRAA